MQQPRYRIDRLDGVSAVDPHVWDALIGDQSPFLEHGFLATLEQTGCVGSHAGWVPLILTIRETYDDRADNDAPLVGALPLYIKTNSSGEFVFDWGWAEGAHRAGIPYYPKAVVAVPFTPVPGARLLVRAGHPDAANIRRLLVEQALALADELRLSSVHFNFLTLYEVALFEELTLPVRVGLQYHWYNEDAQGRPLEKFEDFLGRFRSKRRANVRRERRDLARAGVDVAVVPGEELTDDDMRRMFGYYLDTVTKYFYGQQYLNEAFFLELRHRLAPRLQLAFAREHGVPFGAAFNLLKGSRLYGRYWGCEREIPFAHFEACIYRPIEWCIEQGIEVFEPGAGGTHKYERGFTPTRTYSAHYVRDPRLARAIAEFVALERAHVEEQWQAMAEQSPLKDCVGR